MVIGKGISSLVNMVFEAIREKISIDKQKHPPYTSAHRKGFMALSQVNDRRGGKGHFGNKEGEMYKRKCVWNVSVYVAAVLLALSGIAQSAQKKPVTAAELALYNGPDRQQILEEGARKEGKLTVYHEEVSQIQRLKVASFQKKYPYIKIEPWRADSNLLLSKVIEEYASGRHVVDILEISAGAELSLEEGGGILQPFSSPNMTFIEEGAIRKAAGGGAYSAGIFELPYSLGYNTKLVARAALPKTYKDLLDPKWKGKVALGAAGGRSWLGVLLETYGEDFVKRMDKQNFAVHTVSAMGILNMIANEEYVLSPTIAYAHVSESRKKGAPVEWVPLEPVRISLGQIALPMHPASPHAALLYLDFNLSKETGEFYKATGYDSPRKDIPGERTFKKYYGPFSTKQFAQWNQLFNQLFLGK